MNEGRRKKGNQAERNGENNAKSSKSSSVWDKDVSFDASNVKKTESSKK